MMRAVFGSFQSISLIQGGVRTQLMRTMSALREFMEVQLFDQWTGLDLGPDDIFHIFLASNRTYFLSEAIVARGFNLVVSPVYYRQINPRILRVQTSLSNILPRMYNSNQLGALMTNRASLVLPNSNAEAQYIMTAWKTQGSKIQVIPNGVDARFYEANPNEFAKKYGLTDFVLGVGTLDGRKNFDLLAEVCINLDIPLVLIGRLGSSPRANRIRRLAESGKNILIIEHIDHHSTLLESAYAAARVVALPSDFETPGLVAMEGALAGANVIITSVGGTDEYFGDQAYYVRPRNKQDLLKAVEIMVNKEKTSTLREHIYSNYLWSHVAEKTYNAYKSIGKRKPLFGM